MMRVEDGEAKPLELTPRCWRRVTALAALWGCEPWQVIEQAIWYWHQRAIREGAPVETAP